MKQCIAVALVAGGMAATAASAAVSGAEVSEIRLRYEPAALYSTAGARHLLRRIGDAALETCGASPSSLAELRWITAVSPCWRDAVAQAVRRIDNPMLSAAARETRTIETP